MDIVLNAAFVIAVIAFLKEQFSLKGTAVLVWAFVVCVLVGIAPLIAVYIPIAAPFLEVLVKIAVLFLSAAGGYDAVTSFTRKKTK